MMNASNYSVYNYDAYNTVYFPRALELVLANVYAREYPEFLYSKFLPIVTEGKNKKAVVWRELDRVGFAKFISDASMDVPFVDVRGTENATIIQRIAVGYRYTHFELLTAQTEGVGLLEYKAATARYSVEQLLNQVAFFGDKEHGLEGLFTAENVPIATVSATGTGNSTRWEDKTPDQILGDLNLLIQQMYSATAGAEIPDTIAMPSEKLALLRTRPRSASSDVSIIDYFNRVYPNITLIGELPQTKEAGPNGEDMVVIYKRSADKLAFRVPTLFEQLPVQRSQFEYEVVAHAETGGVNVFVPLSIIKGVGI